MKITIIGSGAGIGLEAVNQALQKGHQVIALSTDTSHIPAHKHLKKIDGSATCINDLRYSIKDSEAVLITVGTRKKKGVTLFSEIAKAIIKLQEETAFDIPVLVVSGFGTGESRNYLSFFMKSVINLFLKDQYKDKTLMESLLEKSNVNWEIVQPGMLEGKGALTSEYDVYPELFKGMKVGKISRADVAHYMLSEVTAPQHLKKKVVLTY